MKIKIFILVLIFANITFAAEINNKFGIYGGGNLNIHSADFYKLAGIPNCCPNFQSGTGFGINAGLLYERKISNLFWFGGRIGILTLDGALIENEQTAIITPTGLTTGTFEHKLESNFMNIGIEPLLMYNPFKRLFLSVGGRFGTNITYTFDQVETITKPSDFGTFLDEMGNDSGLRTRNTYSGDIPKAIPFQMFLTGGVSYEFPFNESNSFRIVPEMQYYLPLNEVAEDTKWQISSLRLGIALKYNPQPKLPQEKIYEKEFKIDTIQIINDIITENTIILGVEETIIAINKEDNKIIETTTMNRTDTLFIPKQYYLTGNIIAVGLDSAGNEIPSPIFKVEEYVSNRLDPLLNYVFFDDNSSTIPNRYKKFNANEVNNFQIESMFRDSTLEIYHNILNIVGRRLTDNPSANIKLVGCNADLGAEKLNTDLSKNRANNVKDYFINVWQIDAKRITVESRNLPEKASKPIEEQDKATENRRVELFSDNPKILEPIFIEKIDRSANPPVVRFKLEAESEAGLRNWEVISYQKSDIINTFNYKKSGDIESQVDWKLSQYQKITPKSAEPIMAELHLEDMKGNTKVINAITKPVEIISLQHKRINRVGDYEIEKFSLILFDFDKSNIEGTNKKIIEFISDRIKPESEVTINGFTDITGDDIYNQKLSNQRAQSTKNTLKLPNAKANGIGEQILLYDNELPEGRFYCRTVEIEVKTLIQ